MKYLMILIFSVIILSGQSIAAEVEQPKKNTYQVIKSEHSFFSSLWRRIQRIVPRNHTAKSTAVLGVRGAETTDSALQPYWADDLTTDPSFRNDIKQFEDGTNLCESNTPTKGSEAFEQLLKNTENDMLKANTMIALASCYAQYGNDMQGRTLLQDFVQKYPKHPMYDEVKTWLSANR